jgi:hypothetical protein
LIRRRQASMQYRTTRRARSVANAEGLEPCGPAGAVENVAAWGGDDSRVGRVGGLGADGACLSVVFVGVGVVVGVVVSVGLEVSWWERRESAGGEEGFAGGGSLLRSGHIVRACK